MAEIWGAALAATVTAGAGYLASQQSAKKAASASAGAGGIGKFKPLDLPPMPNFVPNNFAALNKAAVQADGRGFALSDSDFARRHAPIVEAEKLFEQQVLKDQQGEHELMPAIQNEFVRAGLQGALTSFGDTPGTLAPNSAGEAAVARNLGLNIMGFQDRNRENRTKSLVVAEELFPRRKFGLSGADAAGVMMANTAGQNNWNQADYANKVQLEQFNQTGQANFQNSQVQQQNYLAQAEASAEAAKIQALVSAAEMAAKLGTTYAASRPATTGADPTLTASMSPSTGGWKANTGGVSKLSDRPKGFYTAGV